VLRAQGSDVQRSSSETTYSDEGEEVRYSLSFLMRADSKEHADGFR